MTKDICMCVFVYFRTEDFGHVALTTCRIQTHCFFLAANVLDLKEVQINASKRDAWDCLIFPEFGSSFSSEGKSSSVQ